MNAIFLCEHKHSLHKVYAEHLSYLTTEVGVAETVYSLRDVLDTPTDFHNTEYIFSTWGMPVMTEAQIAACFPNLKCAFSRPGRESIQCLGCQCRSGCGIHTGANHLGK